MEPEDVVKMVNESIQDKVIIPKSHQKDKA